jgi:hypothetical protein
VHISMSIERSTQESYVQSVSTSKPLRNSRTRFLEFCTFFGRGLKAKMEGQNEGKYLKIGEVGIEWRTRRESNPHPPRLRRPIRGFTPGYSALEYPALLQ